MTVELMSGVVAAVLSLVLSYVPGLKQKWEALEGDYKRLVMLMLLLVVAAGSYGLACAGLAADLGLGVTCDQPGLIALVKVFLAALIANQSVFALSPGVRRS